MPSEKVICYDPFEQKLNVFPLSLFEQVAKSVDYQTLDLPHLSKTVVVYTKKESEKQADRTPNKKPQLCTSRRQADGSGIVAVLYLGSLPLGVKLQRHLHIKSKNLHKLRVGSLQPLQQASEDAMMTEKKPPRWSRGLLR